MRKNILIGGLITALFFIGLIAVLTLLNVINFNKDVFKTSKWKKEVNKEEIISYYNDMLDLYKDNSHSYSIIDINNDDIPELLIYTTGIVGNEIIAETKVYTYDKEYGQKDSNYIIFSGVVLGRIDVDTVLYTMNDGTLLSVFGKMGSETATYYKLKDSLLTVIKTTSRLTEDYIKGDNEVIFKSCGELELSNNNNQDNKSEKSENDNVKELFIKDYLTKGDTLLDYSIDKIQILDKEEKEKILKFGDYQASDVLAYVYYSVKPKNIDEWNAGNGTISGEWITNKFACVAIHNGHGILWFFILPARSSA